MGGGSDGSRRIQCQLEPAMPRYMLQAAPLSQAQFAVPDFDAMQALEQEMLEATNLYGYDEADVEEHEKVRKRPLKFEQARAVSPVANSEMRLQQQEQLAREREGLQLTATGAVAANNQSDLQPQNQSRQTDESPRSRFAKNRQERSPLPPARTTTTMKRKSKKNNVTIRLLNVAHQRSQLPILSTNSKDANASLAMSSLIRIDHDAVDRFSRNAYFGEDDHHGSIEHTLHRRHSSAPANTHQAGANANANVGTVKKKTVKLPVLFSMPETHKRELGKQVAGIRRGRVRAHHHGAMLGEDHTPEDRTARQAYARGSRLFRAHQKKSRGGGDGDGRVHSGNTSIFNRLSTGHKVDPERKRM